VKENLGCDGGDPTFTYNYMINNFMSFEKDYPYTAKTGHCKELEAKSDVKLKSYAQLGEVNEEKLKKGEIFLKCFLVIDLKQFFIKAIAEFGPLEISISFLHEKLMRYSSGVYFDSECDGKVLNHAVVVVNFVIFFT
jgi:hypothetical protein